MTTINYNIGQNSNLYIMYIFIRFCISFKFIKYTVHIKYVNSYEANCYLPKIMKSNYLHNNTYIIEFCELYTMNNNSFART